MHSGRSPKPARRMSPTNDTADARYRELDPFVEHFRARYGSALAAIVLYGSFRRGERDTLIDFYVLIHDLRAEPGWRRTALKLLPPNVYYLELDDLRCKWSVMTIEQLQRGVQSSVPYFWARFCQPWDVLWADSNDTRRTLGAVRSSAESAALGAGRQTGARSSREFWIALFQQTYSAELRSEDASRAESLYANAPAHFDALYARTADPSVLPARTRPWRWRIATGKTLSLLRLLKSAATFDDPVGYMLWKVARHSGIVEQATERQRKYPLLFAWPLVWRLYRRGAFR